MSFPVGGEGIQLEVERRSRCCDELFIDKLPLASNFLQPAETVVDGGNTLGLKGLSAGS